MTPSPAWGAAPNGPDGGPAWLLWCLVFLPAAGAVVLASLPRRRADRVAPRVGVAVSGGALACGVGVAATFDYRRAGVVQSDTAARWAGASGTHVHLGVDGISLPLLLLTALLGLLCLVLTLRTLPDPGRPRVFIALVLTIETAALAAFAAQDLLLFFVAFEALLLPIFFLIGIWGGRDRLGAAVVFLVYTLAGSALLLVGFLLVYAHAGTFDLVVLTRSHSGLAGGAQAVAFTAVVAGFAVKTPMWPLHGWLPAAHTEAPTVGSVLLAGVALKTGSYGLIRIAVPLFPDAAHRFAPYLGVLGVVGIVYGSVVCLAQVDLKQGDLKRLVAYSSVSHMGFVLLGIATLTPLGLDAALFASVAHGLITGLLFFVVGGASGRRGTTALVSLGGMAAWAPRLGVWFTFASVAGLGLPGLAGFWGEALAIDAALTPAAGLGRALFAGLAVVAGVGTLLAAAYFLRAVRRVWWGVSPDGARRVRDVTATEFAACAPLAALVVVLGVWPNGLLDVVDPAVRVMLG